MEFTNTELSSFFNVLTSISRYVDQEKPVSNTLFNYFVSHNIIILGPFVEGAQTALNKDLTEEDKKQLAKWGTDRSAISSLEDETKFLNAHADFIPRWKEINESAKQVMSLTNQVELRTVGLENVPNFVNPSQLLVLDKLIVKPE